MYDEFMFCFFKFCFPGIISIKLSMLFFLLLFNTNNDKTLDNIKNQSNPIPIRQTK